MLWDRMSLVGGVLLCVLVLAVGAVNAQVLEPQDAPPPTFFSPPGGDTGGAIIMQPPIPPGAVPQVIWQNGDQMQEAIKPSDHWVGLQCGRMDAALRAQLGLDEDHGVLVEAVVDDSPAAKAGIEKYDVLIKAGDRKLAKVQDLIDEVDEVKDGKLSVELIRKGKKETVQVTPEKRPETPELGEEPGNNLTGEWNKFFDYMQQWEPGKDGRPAMKFRFWRQPGTIMPNQPRAVVPAPTKPGDQLPGNVKIEIRKEGDKPAEIDVTRGDESWTVKEGELDQLPDDLRPHVERMLGRPKRPIGWPVIPPEGFKVPNPLEGREGMFEKRFEDMNRRFDRIERSLKDLFDRSDEKPEIKPKDQPKEKPKKEAEPNAPKLKPSAA